MNLWKIAFSPRSPNRLPLPERVTFGEGNDVSASTSGGGALAFATVKTRGDIWELDVASQQLRQVTFETPIEDHPRLSSDGKSLMVSSNRGGETALWTVDHQGKLANRLASGNFGKWSPDGRQVVFMKGVGSTTKIMVLRIGDVSAREFTVGAGLPSWSPDGRQIVFGSPEAKSALLVKAVEGGAEREIVTIRDFGDAAIFLGFISMIEEKTETSASPPDASISRFAASRPSRPRAMRPILALCLPRQRTRR